MKLIIQIPCFNEERTLPETLRDLPKSIDGIETIETQIIDDGSTDRTVEVAKSLGVNHIVKVQGNRGLANAFKLGVENALANGADILVNTDGDNQYRGDQIPKLVKPIISGRASVVIGCRPIVNHPEFSSFKKGLQLLGSGILRKISDLPVRDATSGFRAYSHRALLQTNVYTQFSYTLETLIQAGFNKTEVVGIDIEINPKTRPSRLFRNIPQFLYKQSKTIVDVLFIYRAAKISFWAALFFFVVSVGLVGRYFYLVNQHPDDASRFWPSLVFSAVFFALSFQFIFTAIMTTVLSANRKLSEEINSRLRELKYDLRKSDFL